MNMELLRIAATIAVAGITVAGVIFANRTQRGSREHKMVDQLQQQMETMQKRMDAFEARDQVYIPHILRLNWHIEQGKGPPAPAIPKVILDFLNNESP